MARRQHLPLHRLSEHRQSRASGRESDAWIMSASTNKEGIGAPVRRKEDRRFLTGNGRYVDDLHVHGQLYAHIVRSQHAHARIKSIDTKAALALPGVVAIF